MTGTITEAMVKIQVISDLHLEASPVEKATDIVNVSSGADVLIIAGDLGSFYDLDPMYKFFECLSPWYKYILYVIGNHEYYRHPSFSVARLGDLRHRAERMFKTIENLHILDRKSVRINGVVFAGATLWSDVERESDVWPEFIRHKLRVSKHVYKSLYKRDYTWIRRTIDSCRKTGDPLVVITHHAPTFTSLRRRGRYESLYASNLDHLIRKENMVMWIHGHTHHNIDRRVRGVNVVSNQRGKTYDRCTLDPNKVKIIEPGDLTEGSSVLYCSPTMLMGATIEKCHPDPTEPYYTIKMDNGRERQTVKSKLRTIYRVRDTQTIP